MQDNVEQNLRKLIAVIITQKDLNHYIDDLLLKIKGRHVIISARVLNKVGISFQCGLHGLNKDITLARKCFSFAFEQGEMLAGLNLAMTSMHISTSNFADEIKLFLFLLEKLHKGHYRLKEKKNDVLYLGGHFFFKAGDCQSARNYFSLVERSHINYPLAQKQIAKIDQMTNNAYSLKQ